MKKKILSLSLVLAIAVLAIAGASMAYFTDSKEAVNTFTVGNVKIELTEPNFVAADAKATPGVTVAKDPVVTNVGSNSAWIRVDVTLSDAAAFTTAATAHQVEDLADIFTIATDFDTKWKLAGTEADTETDTLTYSYYYLTELAPEADTGALFTAVTVPADFTSAEMAAIGDDFTITVTAHAIQADTFETVEDAFAAY